MRFDGSVEPRSSINRTRTEPNLYINTIFYLLSSQKRLIDRPLLNRKTYFFREKSGKSVHKFASQIFFVIFAHENVESRKDRVKEYLFVAEKFGSSSFDRYSRNHISPELLPRKFF